MKQDLEPLVGEKSNPLRCVYCGNKDAKLYKAYEENSL